MSAPRPQAAPRICPFPGQTTKSRSVQAQIRHAANIKEHPLAHSCEPKKDLLANAAARYETRTLHIQMRLCESLFRAAVRALSFRRRDIDGEYFAQFSRGRVTVEVVHLCTHFRSPVGPKRSVLILSEPLPQALRKPAALSTNGVGPQT